MAAQNIRTAEHAGIINAWRDFASAGIVTRSTEAIISRPIVGFLDHNGIDEGRGQNQVVGAVIFLAFDGDLGAHFDRNVACRLGRGRFALPAGSPQGESEAQKRARPKPNARSSDCVRRGSKVVGLRRNFRRRQTERTGPPNPTYTWFFSFHPTYLLRPCARPAGRSPHFRAAR